MRSNTLLVVFLFLFSNLSSQVITENSKILPGQPPGLYYLPKDSSLGLIKLNLSQVVGNQADGSISYGTGYSQKVFEKSLNGGKSKVQIVDSKPTFVLILDKNEKKDVNNWYFSMAKDPSEFIIIQLREKKGKRVFDTGKDNHKGGWGTSKHGIENKVKEAFEFSSTANNVFQIIFKQTLDVGEYCFIFSGTIPSEFNNDKVFDFGIAQSQ
ncbi:MAG: hypothetical protein WCI71_17885 [Bacteroidota bacterium]